MQANLKMRNSFGGALRLDSTAGAARVKPDALPRANFPRELVTAGSRDEGRKLLGALDPAPQAIMPAKISIAAQDSNAAARITK
jgi:hypothetical protein